MKRRVTFCYVCMLLPYWWAIFNFSFIIRCLLKHFDSDDSTLQFNRKSNLPVAVDMTGLLATPLIIFVSMVTQSVDRYS